MKQQLSSRFQRLSRTYGIALSVILLGMSLQWVLLSGSSPLTMAATLEKLPHAPQLIVPGASEARTFTRRAAFQAGMVFPRWGMDGYSSNDSNWQIGLHDIHTLTAANWLELPVDLYQVSLTSTTVMATKDTPTPEALAQGIRMAHTLHYRVFVIPLLSIEELTPGGAYQWNGSIKFPTTEQTRQWFESYWQAFQPYVVAAQQAGAEQLAIGTEDEALQSANPVFWMQLMSNIRAIFTRRLTYDMNWSSLKYPIPSWMHDPRLGLIGVSTYFGLTNTRKRLPPQELPGLWQSQIKPHLDALAAQLGKPILISEIGYRNSSDALYHPWEKDTPAPADPQEQAAAYDAALQNSMTDPHIAGIFFWAWSVYRFQPNWLPAMQILYSWYTSALA